MFWFVFVLPPLAALANITAKMMKLITPDAPSLTTALWDSAHAKEAEKNQTKKLKHDS